MHFLSAIDKSVSVWKDMLVMTKNADALPEMQSMWILYMEDFAKERKKTSGDNILYIPMCILLCGFPCVWYLVSVECPCQIPNT